MKKFLFVLLFVFVSADNISKNQMKIIKKAYEIGSYVTANDGHTFGDTLVSIILTESSAGKYMVGDNYLNGKEKAFLDKSLGPGQVRLGTAIHMILTYPKHYEYFLDLIHKNPYAYKTYSKYLLYIRYFEDVLQRYKHKPGLRAYKVRRWARRELKYYKRKMRPYKKYYKKDLELAQQLLINLDFSLDVSAHYLKYNYNIALKKHMKNPLFRAISRYNGGWNNYKYYRRVMKNMRYWSILKRKYYDYFNER